MPLMSSWLTANGWPTSVKAEGWASILVTKLLQPKELPGFGGLAAPNQEASVSQWLFVVAPLTVAPPAQFVPNVRRWSAW